MRSLVVGSGPAGIPTAEKMRKGDPDSPLVMMITTDPHPAYSPVMLTYRALSLAEQHENGLSIQTCRYYKESSIA